MHGHPCGQSHRSCRSHSLRAGSPYCSPRHCPCLRRWPRASRLIRHCWLQYHGHTTHGTCRPGSKHRHSHQVLVALSWLERRKANKVHREVPHIALYRASSHRVNECNALPGIAQRAPSDGRSEGSAKVAACSDALSASVQFMHPVVHRCSS